MGTARGWEQPGQRALARGGNDSEPPHPTLGAHRAPRPPTSGPARGRASARQPQPHGVSWTREEPSPPRTAAPRAALGEPTTPQAAPALSMAARCPGCDGADDEGGLGHPAGPPRSVFPPGKHSGFQWAAAAFASLGGDRGDPLGTGDPQGVGCAAITPWCRPCLAPGPAAVTSSGCWWGPSLSPGTGTATAMAPPRHAHECAGAQAPPVGGHHLPRGGVGSPGWERSRGTRVPPARALQTPAGRRRPPALSPALSPRGRGPVLPSRGQRPGGLGSHRLGPGGARQPGDPREGLAGLGARPSQGPRPPGDPTTRCRINSFIIWAVAGVPPHRPHPGPPAGWGPGCPRSGCGGGWGGWQGQAMGGQGAPERGPHGRGIQQLRRLRPDELRQQGRSLEGVTLSPRLCRDPQPGDPSSPRGPIQLLL